MKLTRSLAWVALIISAGLIVGAAHSSNPQRRRSRVQPKPQPTPTPRRALPKPVGSGRGFDQFAKRHASSRLVVGAATRGGDDAGRGYQDGETAYAAGKYEEAVAKFTEAVRLKPSWPEARYGLALALNETGKLEDAINEFKEVVRLRGPYRLVVQSHYNVGNNYADLEKYADAIEAYKLSIDLNPDVPESHNNLGLAYAALDRFEEAVAEFSEAVRLKPDYEEAHYNLGVAYLQLRQSDKAEQQQRILAKLNLQLATKLKGLIVN